MHVVSIESDAKYRWSELDKEFQEVCTACGLVRRGGDERCTCGHDFERKKRGFFVTKWEPARLAIRFPDECPHCGGRPEKHIQIWNAQTTRLVGASGRATHKKLEVPVCRRARSPLVLSFLLLLLSACTVVAGLMTAFRVMEGVPWIGIFVTLGLGALGYLVWRAMTWIRFSYFDHRSFRFKVRRKDYAHELAGLNDGRVA